VGHSVTLHGCRIERRCLIGIGAIVLNGAVVGEESIIAAGSLVPEGMAIPPRSLAMGTPAKVRRELTEEERALFLDAAEAVKRIYVSPAIKRYIVELTTRTRQSGDVYLGASPRGSLGLARAGQARAALVGRDHVLPDDIQALAGPVLSHRIIVSPAARLRDLSSERIMQEVVQATPVPGGEFSTEPPRKISK